MAWYIIVDGAKYLCDTLEQALGFACPDGICDPAVAEIGEIRSGEPVRQFSIDELRSQCEERWPGRGKPEPA